MADTVYLIDGDGAVPVEIVDARGDKAVVREIDGDNEVLELVDRREVVTGKWAAAAAMLSAAEPSKSKDDDDDDGDCCAAKQSAGQCRFDAVADDVATGFLGGLLLGGGKTYETTRNPDGTITVKRVG